MYLEKINNPDDLKRISQDKLPLLAQEIRDKIIQVVSKSGGHLASSLGVVELSIALHYCFNAPDDKIVWDVGHQAYAHKLLTGRHKTFETLRQGGGISGFPTKEESIFDIFTTGHASTAVSLALGLVNGKNKVAAVIGDGSISGGLCFEGLNNAGHSDKDILVILNTNEMSIAPAVGAISTHLNKIISMPIYNRFKSSLDHFIKDKIPRVGPRVLRLKERFEESFKNLLIPGIFFEELGYRYFGPLDGHDLDLIIPTIKNILTIKSPILLHVVTKKGKGYEPAEKEPVRFHSASAFDIKTGKGINPKVRSYSDVFGEKIARLAQRDKRIVAITAAMPEGTGLDKFRDRFPARFFDVGIAESHAVCFAAGLSKRGLRPVVAIYSTFLQRAYDQLIEEAALQKSNIIFAIDRAGIVGQDGVTHQGTWDICYLRNIPDIAIMAPKDAKELEKMLEFAVEYEQGPIAIRYPRDEARILQGPSSKIELSMPEVLRTGKDVIFFAIGTMVMPALEAAEMLAKEGVEATIVNARFVKPLNREALLELVGKKTVFTAEEGVLDGGFGSAIQEAINLPVTRMGLPCEFISHAKRKILLEKYGLTKEGFFDTIIKKQKAKSHLGFKLKK